LNLHTVELAKPWPIHLSRLLRLGGERMPGL